ncbi:tyrosine-type recombinase/integrase [Roseinatronobacter alkalisoli]|uniref:Tyrosine-type recombinase/integrase n=1 Tax=Roseinatronobacter alkalisoli TaxID=3028235 RepID=A0ABT5THL7_9RHOB|nr:tyrosine-type recombinase/integrase [Roseinatronobacter sp. HJB301]MDD7973682.1 tyrosine-type recombinase/integrase [Roseinatronobacter sp. HJB301]
MRTRLCKRKLTDDPDNLLAPVFPAYREILTEGQYVVDIQGRYFAAIFHFGDWLRFSNICIQDVRHEHICDFLHNHLPACTSKRHTRSDPKKYRSALLLLEKVMLARGFAVPKPTTAIDAELLAFDVRMKQVWGYADSTRAARCLIIKRFLNERFSGQDIDLTMISSDDIKSFIVGGGNRGSGSARWVSGTIRCFLRYRQLLGDDVSHLMRAIPTLARAKPPALPEAFNDAEVTALLNSFSDDFPRRRRAFAIARCLIDLGLRSSEVAGLTLDDIDWERGTIRVHNRKGRRADVMPLLVTTGEAITDYIQKERPPTNCRNIFVRASAPVGQAVGRRAVQATMLAAYRRLGWNRSRVHVLRHTLATRLLSAGTPMPTIADVMRHRSLSTTVIYTRLDTAWLSEVSMPWPEDIQ